MGQDNRCPENRGADPLVRAGPPGPASGRRGRRPRARAPAPPLIPIGGPRARGDFLTVAVLLLLAGAWPLAQAQSIAPGMIAGPLSGSVPTGQATPGVLDLGIDDAIARGLKYNLALVESGENARLARAERLRGLSRLLPTVSIRPSVTEQQISLAAFGFSAPGFPTIVGPFTVVDARASLAQSVFSLRDRRHYQASQESERAAGLSLRDAREQVVLVVTALYLEALAASARIDAQRALVATAETAFRLASDRRGAGTAPGIDVLRAQVQLEAEQQRLIAYEGEFDKQLLDLARAIGLPPGQAFRLTDKIPYQPLPAGVTLESTLERAYRQRADYQAAAAEVKAAELERGAAEAGRYPSATFDANYGAIGQSIQHTHGTFAVAGGVDIPIFQGGRVKADVESASAKVHQRQAELEDLRGRIDAQVRRAFIDVHSAARQVEVAVHSVGLAGQQFEQARDRFAAGVTNNLEVVQAQQAVAVANENYISSLFSYNLACATLVRARGDAVETIQDFIRRQKSDAKP